MNADFAPKRVDRVGATGLRLVATESGPPDGAPVIMLHGGGQTRQAWSRSASVLAARGLRVIALDMRGHGDSDWAPDGYYALDAFANDLRAVIEPLDRAPVLVGASLGGLASLLACGEEPRAACVALVLVDVVPWLEPSGGEHVVGFMRGTSAGFDSLEDAANSIADYLPHRPRPTRLDGLSKNLRQQADGRWYWHWDPAFIAPRTTWSYDETNARLTAAALSIDAPMLLVRGTRSEIVTDESAERFRALLPHARTVDIADAHHMVAGDDNDAFLDAVVEFAIDPQGAKA